MVRPNKKKIRRDAAEIIKEAKDVLRIEAEGILGLIDRVDSEFAEAVNWIYESRGRVIVTGIGKSGIVGRKIVATLNSTGTKSLFLHPVEAMHGDLGMVSSDDIVLVLSSSGETEELTAILPTLKDLGTRIICFTGNTESTLGRNSDLTVYAGVEREACPLGLAPHRQHYRHACLGRRSMRNTLKQARVSAGGFSPLPSRRSTGRATSSTN